MSESIGAALRAAREKRQLTLAQVSESTRVRPHYLQALENDDISAMPSAAQARGFLKLYADFLGLDLSTLIPPPGAAASAALPPIAAPPPATPGPKTAGPSLVSRLRGRIASLSRTKADTSGPTTEDGGASAGDSPAAVESQADAADKKKAPN